MSEDEIAALLGRPLMPLEVENFTEYLKIAQERLEDLTCLNLNEETEDRVFDVREGYTTVFTDPFVAINSVKINGNAVSDYTPMQWNRRKADWYNSIVLKNVTCADEITINADWEIASPELELLIARLFGLLNAESSGNNNIKSKRVNDFQITFNDNSVYQQFLIDNQALIDKYSLCNIGNIQHGSTRRFDGSSSL